MDKHKKRSRKTKWLRVTNKLINTFFESSSNENEGNVTQYISNCETKLELY